VIKSMLQTSIIFENYIDACTYGNNMKKIVNIRVFMFLILCLCLCLLWGTALHNKKYRSKNKIFIFIMLYFLFLVVISTLKVNSYENKYTLINFTRKCLHHKILIPCFITYKY